MIDDEILPFDVEIERLPIWVHALSAIVMVVGIGVAIHLIPMVAFLPFLILSSIGRRLSSSARQVEISRATLRIVDGVSVAAKDIRDVWLDEEEARVVVAHGDYSDLLVMMFKNREQAARCAEALNEIRCGERSSPRAIVGFRPRWIDALPSLRFLALAIAFFGTGAVVWISATILALFVVNAFFIVNARQIVVLDDGRWISRSLFGETQRKVETVAELPEIARSSLRDPLLASPLWITRARDRALGEMRKRATQTDSQDHPLS